MKIYLAARYSRHPELQVYAGELRAAGHEVTSRWINGDHQISDAGLAESGEGTVAERERFALEDFEDLTNADICISFTEAPRSSYSRGGRHVEFGIALGLEISCIVVGPRENVFCCLPQVFHCPTWDDALTALTTGIRVCKKCGYARNLTDFYTCGVRNRSRRKVCRFCIIKRTRTAIDKDPERHNEYGKRAYRRNKPGRRAAVRRWYTRNPHAHDAHNAVARALRSGRLVKPSTCDECERRVRLHAHHDDYTRPLAVRWLCARCHRRIHSSSLEALS